MLELRKPNTVLAHSDAYPTYERKLRDQFCNDSNNSELYAELCTRFDMNVDYPQTTILLYDTNLIQDTTFRDLVYLTKIYPNSITNDQGLLALYFTNIVKCWEQIPIKNDKIHFYDYMKRNTSDPYIMTKWNY